MTPVPAPGYAQLRAGTTVFRVHSKDFGPSWYSPPVGVGGTQRYHPHGPRLASQYGTCFVALQLSGAVLETILRDLVLPLLTAPMVAPYAVSLGTLDRDVVLTDFIGSVHTVWGHTLGTLTASPPYTATQRITADQMALGHPHPVDGIQYLSRFSGRRECMALWDRLGPCVTFSAPAHRLNDPSAMITHPRTLRPVAVPTLLAEELNDLGMGLASSFIRV